MKRVLISYMLLSLVLTACSEVELPPDTEVPPETDTSSYSNGSYSETVYYYTPAGEDVLNLEIRVEDERIVELSVHADTNSETSADFQELFLDEVESIVVGSHLDDLPYISAINGSSLLAEAFSDALYGVREQAML
jgi:hypothetical protein